MSKQWYELLTFERRPVGDVVTEVQRAQDDDDQALMEHVLTCRTDGFCYVCRCL